MAALSHHLQSLIRRAYFMPGTVTDIVGAMAHMGFAVSEDDILDEWVRLAILDPLFSQARPEQGVASCDKSELLTLAERLVA